MKRDLTEISDFIKKIAAQAAALVLEMRKDDLAYDLKSPKQIVTLADKASEKLIIDAIREKFPHDIILSEETNPSASQDIFNEPSWIIDPIDGTTNYLHRHKHIAVSIAYAEAGTVLVGVVNMPFYGEVFSAVKGQGAYLNDQKISCDAGNIALEDAVILLGRPKDGYEEPYARSVQEILRHCFDIRRYAAAAGDICWVACGRAQAFWESLQPWDIAAACLIAKEAGAAVGRVGKHPDPLPLPEDLYSEGVVVTTPAIYQDFVKLLAYI